MDDNSRAVIGGNSPPNWLDDAAALPTRIELDHAELLERAALLDLDRFSLPKTLASDADCALVTGFVVKAKRVAKELEDARKATGAPYLAAQRTINDTFQGYGAGVESAIETETKRTGLYAKVKADRERAERLAKEAEERAKAQVARDKEAADRKAADDAAAEAEAAAAKIRQAKTDEERHAAAQEMVAAETKASDLREQAEETAETAAKAERRADQHERAADAGGARLSRISGLGGTASVTKRWSYRIEDISKVRATMGPLGAHFAYHDIETTIARVIREESKGGAAPTFRLDGIDVFEIDATHIRAAR